MCNKILQKSLENLRNPPFRNRGMQHVMQKKKKRRRVECLHVKNSPSFSIYFFSVIFSKAFQPKVEHGARRRREGGRARPGTQSSGRRDV